MQCTDTAHLCCSLMPRPYQRVGSLLLPCMGCLLTQYLVMLSVPKGVFDPSGVHGEGIPLAAQEILQDSLRVMGMIGFYFKSPLKK